MSHTLPHPDPMPLREALRGLRHGLRRLRRTLREVVPVEGLPGPAARLAGPVLEGLDSLAGGLDAAGTDLARRLLGGAAHRVPSFATLADDPDRDEVFAEAAYAALRGALLRLGANDAFVSEAAARGAFPPPAAPEAEADLPRLAAGLARHLIDATVIRDLPAAPGLRVDVAQAPTVAVVAAMLWLMADRPGADLGAEADPGMGPEATLDAATDIAVALAAELAEAAADPDRLAALLGRFAPHV